LAEPDVDLSHIEIESSAAKALAPALIIVSSGAFADR
jgi:hypothetical protein